MAIRPIIIAPDPVLKAKAKPVENIDGGIVRLMDDMLETMYKAPGIGLAAPQIGILQRVIVVDVAEKDEKPQPFAMANPEILWQ
jgi:peptide deformylase